MTPPNMATITASLERSLQNCSLNHHSSGSGSGNGNGNGGGEGGAGGVIGDDNNNNLGGGIERSSTSGCDAPENSDDTTLELNSQISLPYHWEQCLDLKTGEIYYINWSNGMKAREDPRTVVDSSGDFYSEEDDSSCDSEESSSESSPPSSGSASSKYHHHQQHYGGGRVEKEDHVLVVAGCKSCFMYYMVPKQVGDCPKCSGQLLHFDRSENRSS